MKKTLLARSIAIGGALMLLKAGAGWLSGSLALMASAADSLMDLMVSVANFIFFRMASKPADDDHAYGHGKIESLAGLLQSLVIGGVALGIAGGAVHRFLHPEPVTNTWTGVAVIVAAIALNLWHTRNLRAAAFNSQSAVMRTEYAHYASDTLAHIGVIAALVLGRFTGLTFWDPLVSVLIVVYLFRAVTPIFNDALSELLDEQLPEDEIAKLHGVITGFDRRVAGYHNLRTRRVGETRFIDFHVELKDVQRFDEAHDLTEDLIEAIEGLFPGAVVTVHSDPARHDGPRRERNRP